MEVFNYNDKFIEIKQLPHEPRELYVKRAWFILNRIDNCKKSFDELVRFSIIWSNMNTLKCKYSKDLEDELEKIIQTK